MGIDPDSVAKSRFGAACKCLKLLARLESDLVWPKDLILPRLCPSVLLDDFRFIPLVKELFPKPD